MVSPEFQPPRYDDPPRLPPDGFDPVNNPSDAALLAEFWLPDRPNEITEPELFAHWAEMMKPPLRYIWAHDEPPVHGTLQITESQNWSGAVTLPNTGGRFVRVVGRWVVPKVKAGADPNPNGISEGSSMWVGLDGSFPWSQAMPQIGSAHYIDVNGQSNYSLWFQCWLKNLPSSPQIIGAMKVSEGDIIYANISKLSNHIVHVHIANHSTKTFTTKKIWCSMPFLGATAEWIMERPADAQFATLGQPNGPLYPLPDYGSIPVSRCATRMDNGRLPCWSPRLLRLAEVMPDHPHMVVESIPKRRGQASHTFRLDYKRPA